MPTYDRQVEIDLKKDSKWDIQNRDAQRARKGLWPAARRSLQPGKIWQTNPYFEQRG